MRNNNTAAIIVNWREPHMTLRAVDSLLSQSIKLDRIIVVDNGSGDDSSNILADAVQQYDSCDLIELPENLGFGGGNNAALRILLDAGFDTIWLFNNDAIADKKCHEELLQTMNSDAQIGAVGSIINDPKHSDNNAIGHYFDLKSLTAKMLYDEGALNQKPYAWVTAASLYLRGDALRKAGIFDEGFFMYWEDVDLCMRIKEAGYSLSVAQNAIVEHEAGTSSDAIPVQRYLWHLSSHLHWHQKHVSSGIMARMRIKSKYLLKAIIDRDRARALALFKAILH